MDTSRERRIETPCDEEVPLATDAPRHHPLNRPRLATALFVLLVLAAYYPATKGEFFSDDFVYVLGNDTLQTVPLGQPWRFFLERTNPYEYLPLRDLSYRLDWALFGNDPFGYHVHNLLL